MIDEFFISGLIILAQIMAVIVPIFISVAFLVYAERKVLALIQLRRGPNVVGPFGLLQSFADALKLLTKENIIIIVNIFPNNFEQFDRKVTQLNKNVHQIRLKIPLIQFKSPLVHYCFMTILANGTHLAIHLPPKQRDNHDHRPTPKTKK